MGYAGGQTKTPTYRNIGDHTETVQIDYDPTRITYDELLTIFWKSHQPFSQAWSIQYQNSIFFQNEQQHQMAITSKKALEKQTGKKVKTKIAPLQSFTLAEDYHQKYLLTHHSLNKEIQRFYPIHKDLIDSTAAARLNGYAGGYGSRDQLSKEIEDLGLSSKGRAALIKMVQK